MEFHQTMVVGAGSGQGDVADDGWSTSIPQVRQGTLSSWSHLFHKFSQLLSNMDRALPFPRSDNQSPFHSHHSHYHYHHHYHYIRWYKTGKMYISVVSFDARALGLVWLVLARLLCESFWKLESWKLHRKLLRPEVPSASALPLPFPFIINFSTIYHVNLFKGPDVTSTGLLKVAKKVWKLSKVHLGKG